MTSRRTNWTEEEEKLLFELHREFGNKWSTIASRIPQKDDSCIKNKFYSTLRKGLRKINSYVTNVKKKLDPTKYKAYKSFPELFLTKIISVVDRNFDQKFQVKPRAIELASNIQARIIEVACSITEYLKPQAINYNFQEILLGDIQEFNKNCKKRKGKRKQTEEKGNMSDNDEELPHVAKTIEESEMLQSSSESPFFCKKPSFRTERVQEKSNEKGESKPTITVQNSNNPYKVEEELFSMHPINNGICTVNKQSSMATTVLDNNSRQFASKAQEFFRVMEDNPMTHSSNMSMSNSWIYDSSGDLSRRANNLFQPSPLPSSDSYSPFSFTNLMRNHNVTLSSQFDQKNNSIDLFSSSKLYQSKRQQNVLSLVDQLPLYQANRANFLVKSEDLLKSTDLVSKISENSCKETISGTPFKTMSDQSTLNQFLAGFNGRSFIGGSFDEKMKEYKFGDNSEVFGPKSES